MKVKDLSYTLYKYEILYLHNYTIIFYVGSVYKLINLIQNIKTSMMQFSLKRVQLLLNDYNCGIMRIIQNICTVNSHL